MTSLGFTKISRGGENYENPYATTSHLDYNGTAGFVMRENPRQRGTGYTANLRPVLPYIASQDEDAVFKEQCKPSNMYVCTTESTYRSPGTWDHNSSRSINDITTRYPQANGFVKDIPITLPKQSQNVRSFDTTTGTTFEQQPYHPQQSEPRRGVEWSEETWKADYQKTRSSVYHKERHGNDIINSRAMYREGEQDVARMDGRANISQTKTNFVQPLYKQLGKNELPNLIQQRDPFDRSGNSGGNSFTMSTIARPVYLTDPRKESDGKWKVDTGNVAGAAIAARAARTDPCEALNMTAPLDRSIGKASHGYKKTTREVDVTKESIGYRPIVGKKTASGYASNTAPLGGTAIYLPESRNTYNTTYGLGHCNDSNYNMPARAREVHNVEPVRDNGFVRGTLGYTQQKMGERPGKEEIDLLARAHPQVARGNMMRDPFLVDTRHNHKTHNSSNHPPPGVQHPRLVTTTSRV